MSCFYVSLTNLDESVPRLQCGHNGVKKRFECSQQSRIAAISKTNPDDLNRCTGLDSSLREIFIFSHYHQCMFGGVLTDFSILCRGQADIQYVLGFVSLGAEIVG